MKGRIKAWQNEKKKHLGDYGCSSEHDLECAFYAGWIASKRDTQKQRRTQMFVHDED